MLCDESIHELTEAEEIRWQLFGDRLKENGTEKTPQDSKKQVITLQSDS